MRSPVAPDGYTLRLGGIASHAIAPRSMQAALQRAHRFHLRVDHVAAAQHAGGHLDLPAKTVAELIELLKTNRASTRTPRPQRQTLHLSGELFKVMPRST